MTRVINFDRSFKITVPISLVIIIAGLFGYIFIGFNNGVDFQPGMNTSVRFAPASMVVSYAGPDSVKLAVSKTGADILTLSTSGESVNYNFPFAKYETFQAMADGFKTVVGVNVELKAAGNVSSNLLLGASQSDAPISKEPATLHYAVPIAAGTPTVDEIRGAMAKGFGEVSIQREGDESSASFMIRVQDNGKDPNLSSTLRKNLSSTLSSSFGEENVLIVSSTFVGARFSKALADQAVWLTLVTFLVILLYCSLRFKPVYAIGAVLSVVHDALVLVAFIVFTRLEFDTSIIAAILTIVGFSINDTIVIYDRIREKVRLNPDAIFRENMNRGVTETLGRTFITSGTVLLSAVALYIFTTGTMKNFALCILVGVTTGTYSSVFIASAFVDLWKVVEAKREKARQALTALTKPAATQKKA